jgi:hypothetical protein
MAQIDPENAVEISYVDSPTFRRRECMSLPSDDGVSTNDQTAVVKTKAAIARGLCGSANASRLSPAAAANAQTHDTDPADRHDCGAGALQQDEEEAGGAD